ncbi:MAG: HIT family protein [Candidatus Magasanikbacteria bacterium]
MPDCIFCKIVGRDIPNYTVYEDNHVLAFLDINPIAKGHTVLIPKVHAETVFDLNDELEKELFPAIDHVMSILQDKLSPDGFNVGWNHLGAGGQVVLHLHIHIIPRWDCDGGGNIHSVINNPGSVSVEDVASKF